MDTKTLCACQRECPGLRDIETRMTNTMGERDEPLGEVHNTAVAIGENGDGHPGSVVCAGKA